MEMYNVPEQGNSTNAYMIQGTESNPQFTALLPEQFQAMYSEGAPEFVVDQGMYYPTPNNYGYICTGYESSGDWDDHHRVIGLDGQDIQYMGGAQAENLPYVYYTPGYGYTQSLYNPYNPYIPGAMIGADGSFVGTHQQYYTVPTYDNSSSSHFPMVQSSRSDITSTDPFIDTTANRADGGQVGLKHSMSSASPAFSLAPYGPASSQTNSFPRVSEGSKSSVGGTTKQPLRHAGGVSSGSFHKPPQAVQGRGAQPVENISQAKTFSSRHQPKINQSMGDSVSSFGSSASARTTTDKFQPKFFYGKITDDVKATPDILSEQNRGPRTNKSKNQLVVKAYTTKAGDVDEQGNIVIDTDQYNRDDFMIDFPNAKFFVIKSYSEDDVHKSIKYNVWSSTPNGNKKLSSAYEDAQRVAAGDPKGCPIFLFFSVNASGQFCGVAEMTGPVDFHKDMDFWQQDKWTGSFPVKWHIIKDVPNPNFRHIVLENNENKPVTNSRDTQEIRQRKGIEVLKIFKSYASRTSLLDDFMYYENRQKILQEEKARLLIKNYGSSFIVPVLDPPRKLQSFLNMTSSEDEKIVKLKNSGGDSKMVVADERVEQISSEGLKTFQADNNDRDVNIDSLKFGSLTINPKAKQSRAERDEASATATTAVPVASMASVDVVTVGSVPVKVKSSDFLTVGTIQFNPRALQRN